MSSPSTEVALQSANSDAVLSVRNLVHDYRTRHGIVNAVSSVDLDVQGGEVLGLVGESGCGKSTLARTIMQEPRPTSGSVVVEGIDLGRLRGRELRRSRRRIHMVFQDPTGSLNPRWTAARSLAEAYVGPPADKARRIDGVLQSVELEPNRFRDRRPGQMSGGQCQRVAIARALIAEPAVIIFDEAVSSLDVSIQAQILNLLERIRRENGLTAIFIAHDLAVVRHVSDRVAVMYLGRICEVASSVDLYAQPLHPYTAALLASIPTFDDDAGELALTGDPPSPLHPPSGCRFRTRCWRAADRCAAEQPTLRELTPGHLVACHFPLEGVAVADPVLRSITPVRSIEDTTP